MKRRPERGDRYMWRHDDAPDRPVYIEVNRVARDGSWADITCCTWAAMWRKRQPLPLPAGTTRYLWTQEDLDRDARRADLRFNAALCVEGIHEAEGSCCPEGARQVGETS